MSEPWSEYVQIRLLQSDAQIPTRATSGSAGFDLYALANTILKPDIPTAVRTGIAIQLPGPSWEAQVRPRSSMGFKGIIIPNCPGTIDSDYQGEILVLMLSLIDHYEIKKGDRIAQLVFSRVLTDFDFEEVNHFVFNTVRGAGGFGSTGK